MKAISLILVLCAQAVLGTSSSELTDSTIISIQPVTSTSTSTISSLAEIQYNPSTLTSSLISFEQPDLSSTSELLRVGIYDVSTSSWKSSTTTTSVDTFAKGYSPTLLISLDSQGEVIGVTIKSGKIDAGATRDFGPKVKIVRAGKGKLPELNRPVVLSSEGKLEEPEPEKTMLQKYWWVLLGAVMLLMTTGGE